MLNLQEICKNRLNFVRNCETLVYKNGKSCKKIQSSFANLFNETDWFRFHKITQLTTILLIFSFLNTNSLFSQSQTDFADPYDFNLRNYKDSQAREVFQEYTVPPTFKKPALISPKNVQIPFESPFPATGGLRRTTTPNTERRQDNLVNPLTGNINVETILQRQAQQQADKKRKQNQVFEEEKYTETTFRRFTIIFFMTLPITLGIGYAIAANARVPGYHKFQKTFGGSIFIFTFGTSLAFANAWHDMKEYESMKKENQPESPPVEPTSADSLGFGNSLPISGSASASPVPGREYKLEISLFNVSF
ncbi:hypothetical protein ACO2J1_16570 [Leptospira interrogans]|uniref:Uncharacterized protein n=13 Tax=Leptospira interrogans TaxID=173 RepID=A0A0E2D5H8_LEPIR|nr:MULTISPECIES: hypothetical protein [Leptospira]EMF45070.1 hypothetical protein LEP1GSC067_1930 [Leptospira interrogans serovar Lora str. TE 1992]EMN29033.1 hypothetical protein LEP1GSC083_4385 [Leptospira interrogans serovar Pyrogenes str. L0374]EMN69545.1 hypothetical protein LEP1GSC100_0028 [Leptospira interrogans serovar Bataviae str. UI 08561]AKH78542.1 hypothetical protein BRAT_16805 [Leptospira interrogans serovar Bratislava]ASV06292.1 hypothetical protein B2G47_10315 [Leptospira inte